MKYFVIDNKNGNFDIDITLARHIFRLLNINEQNEINSWLNNNTRMSLESAIKLLYGTLSQRRRMNPRLVKAVKEYRIKNKNCSLVPVAINDDVNYIDVKINDDNSESIVTFKDEEGIKNNAEPISLWIEQKTYSDEMSENSGKELTFKDLFKVEKTKFSLKKKITSWYKKLRRWLYQLFHKDVKKFEKNYKKQKNTRRVK